MTFRRVPLVILAIAVVATQVTRADDRIVDYGTWISAKVVQRAAEDLGLEEESAGYLVFHALWETYRTRLESKRSKLDEEAHLLMRTLTLEIAPELDESYDITELPEQEQTRIRSMRELFARGITPIVDDARFAGPWNKASKRLAREIIAHEIACRNEFMAACAQFVTAGQAAEIVARAQRRLDINMHVLIRLGVTLDSQRVTDPVWKLDVLGLLAAAAQADGELETWSKIILVPESAVGEREEGLIGNLAALIDTFEREYSELIATFETQFPEWQLSYMRAFNEGHYGAARALLNRDERGRQAIIARRRRFGTELGKIVGEINPGLEARWLHRYRIAECPALFSEDSVDVVVRRLRELNDLSEDEKGVVDALYTRYLTERIPLLDRAYNLEVQEYCARQLPLKSEPPSRESAALGRAHQKRVELADRTVGRLRGSVDQSRNEIIDEIVAAYKKRTERWVEPRP